MKFWIAASLIIWVSLIKQVTPRIGCYRCISSNGSNPACEDPFNSRDVSYERYCKAMKRNRVGLFPATFCVKLHGYDPGTQERTFIRECTTEDIGNYKGTFQLNGKDVSGVVATCRGNGCNKATAIRSVSVTWLSVVAACTVMCTGLAFWY